MKNIYELYGSEDLSEHYYYKDELSRGRPEICSDGRFRPVCDASWDLQDASVVCRTLGFSPYGKHGLFRNVQYSGCYTPVYSKEPLLIEVVYTEQSKVLLSGICCIAMEQKIQLQSAW